MTGVTITGIIPLRTPRAVRAARLDLGQTPLGTATTSYPDTDSDFD
jgi:hypothetical protein